MNLTCSKCGAVDDGLGIHDCSHPAPLVATPWDISNEELEDLKLKFLEALDDPRNWFVIIPATEEVEFKSWVLGDDGQWRENHEPPAWESTPEEGQEP